MKQIVLVKSLTEWSVSAMINQPERGGMREDMTSENLFAGELEPEACPFGASAGWLFSGEMAQVDRFILISASQIHPLDLCVINEKGQQVYEKIYRIREAGLNALKRQSRIIMQTLEFAAGMQLVDPLPAYLAEGTFAMQYLLREHDLISDLIPGIGLIDDAILVKRVFSRNEADFMRLEILLTRGARPKI
ncbi:MAG TPA: YkvA family protein [Chthoniobacterales bacterium]|jgi:uncharacterized membrane protein YkvA (DUF1232 family)|nr:YkvA family protein [Chthoniobacterales bacterium]